VWLAWCGLWALGWLIAGLAFFPFWLLTIGSVLAMLVPVGKDSRQLPPPPAGKQLGTGWWCSEHHRPAGECRAQHR
jgi:hypothetical protein